MEQTSHDEHLRRPDTGDLRRVSGPGSSRRGRRALPLRADARAAVLRLGRGVAAPGLRSATPWRCSRQPAGDHARTVGDPPDRRLDRLHHPRSRLPEILAFVRRAQASALIFDPWDARGAELARQAEPRVVLSTGPRRYRHGRDPALFAPTRRPPRDLPRRPGDQGRDIHALLYWGTTGAPKMVRQGHNYYVTR